MKKLKKESEEERRIEEGSNGTEEQLLTLPSPHPTSCFNFDDRLFFADVHSFPDLGRIQEFIQLAVLTQSPEKNSTNVLSFNARWALLLLASCFLPVN